MTNTELRLNDLKKQIRHFFNEARKIGRNEPETFRSFANDVAVLTTEDIEPAVPIPTKAPELYKDRKNKSEKPEAFLERVYEGLTGTPERPAKIVRSHIKALDHRLYEALYKRRKIIDNFETLLPPSQGKSVDDLSVSPSEFMNRYRERDAARKRQYRKSNMS
ncbi:hypothetical protein QTA57_17960 [Fontisubflavum oceani]|uniref:hypothetical protein n=1 Tax=Fontisubflavum oceani TaxID=2978973 RepID=UPI0025B59EB6|nr:hypothetical protein [Fontisubflavum oceani]WJY21585.1 hypothetical protein QTA57_17960 [Fontisubflavum oceani]